VYILSFASYCLVTFRVSRRRREMYCGQPRLCVCLSVCPRPYCTDPDVTFGSGRGCPPGCAVLGGFAIGGAGCVAMAT